MDGALRASKFWERLKRAVTPPRESVTPAAGSNVAIMEVILKTHATLYILIRFMFEHVLLEGCSLRLCFSHSWIILHESLSKIRP